MGGEEEQRTSGGSSRGPTVIRQVMHNSKRRCTMQIELRIQPAVHVLREWLKDKKTRVFLCVRVWEFLSGKRHKLATQTRQYKLKINSCISTGGPSRQFSACKVREEFNSGRWGEKMHGGGREMSRQGGGSRRRLGQKKVHQPREQPEMKWRAETSTWDLWSVAVGLS